MKTKHALIFVFAAAFLLLVVTGGVSQAVQTWASPVSPQAPFGSGFTYQGSLTLEGVPANGYYDFSFDLYNAASGGLLIDTIVIEDWLVEDGIFTVILDYGAGEFEGEERWLEIGVRPYDDPGVFTILEGRQPLTPTPYALFANLAGAVVWKNIVNIPADLEDGDDDTTYSAGTGLDLTGTTFSVDTDTIQARVTGDCEIGSTIRAINADGTVECEPHDTRPVFNHVAVDNTAIVGFYSSITIGADGLPIISYNAHILGQLRVAHCNDLACTSATITTLDATDAVGWDSSIIIGVDGLPIISYHDYTNTDLKVAHCDDLTCTSATITALDTADDVGEYTSITIGVDGLPIISYYDATNDALKTAHCSNVTCTSATIATLDASAEVGTFSSIIIGVDGLPVISYYDSTNDDLRVVHCANVTCTAITSITSPDSTNDVGQYSSIAIGIDGLPIISYYDTTADDLKVAHCTDSACTSAATTALDTTGNVGRYTSISIGMDGLPVISYIDATSNYLKVAHCKNISCTSAHIVRLVESYDYGSTNGITVGVDGFPIISHFDNDYGFLLVTHCSNLFCLPNWRMR